MWGFCKADKIETVQLQFCKHLLCIKQCTQNDFVYGELGLSSLQNKRFYMIIKYWLKIVLRNENKYIKHDVARYRHDARERKLGGIS